MLAAITPFMCFVGFLLLLLVSLSVPIIKAVYLFHLVGHAGISLLDVSAGGSAWFGVWGYCVSAIDVSVVGIDVAGTNATCSKAELGYDLSPFVLDVLHASDTNLDPATINRDITAVLVLHPIACGIAFLALATSFIIVRYARSAPGAPRALPIIALIVGFLAAVLTTAVFLIDVIFVAVVRKRVESKSDGILTLNWGNAVWMVLGATVALWLALVGSCAGVCCMRRHRKVSKY